MFPETSAEWRRKIVKKAKSLFFHNYKNATQFGEPRQNTIKKTVHFSEKIVKHRSWPSV